MQVIGFSSWQNLTALDALYLVYIQVRCMHLQMQSRLQTNKGRVQCRSTGLGNVAPQNVKEKSGDEIGSLYLFHRVEWRLWHQWTSL